MYPSEAQQLGLVSTIADDPPMLNWIFVDEDNNLLRHGGRQETLGGHVVGPWYWTDDEEWLTLDKNGNEFIAVLLPNDKWSIAWDRDGRIKESGELWGDETESESEEDEESSSDDDSEEGGSSEVDESERKEKPTRKQQRSGGGGKGTGRGGASGGGGLKWVPIRLRRQLQLGMKSQYVKGQGQGQGQGEQQGKEGEGGDKREG